MPNFYTDTPQFKHYLQHPLMKRIVELRERNYADAEKYDYAPMDFEDAMDSYDKVLEVVGEICRHKAALAYKFANKVGTFAHYHIPGAEQLSAKYNYKNSYQSLSDNLPSDPEKRAFRHIA